MYVHGRSYGHNLCCGPPLILVRTVKQAFLDMRANILDAKDRVSRGGDSKRPSTTGIKLSNDTSDKLIPLDKQWRDWIAVPPFCKITRVTKLPGLASLQHINLTIKQWLYLRFERLVIKDETNWRFLVKWLKWQKGRRRSCDFSVVVSMGGGNRKPTRDPSLRLSPISWQY